MPYLDKYKFYLDEMRNCLDTLDKTEKYTVFGYTSNLDVLMKWDVHKLNQILEKYLVGQPRANEAETISDLTSFARIVSYYVMNGLGGEINITDIRVCEYLQGMFETYPALGGTCAQGAAALGTLGVPLVAHITDRSNEVCEYLNYSKISIFSDGQLRSANQAVSGEEPVRHMILQYNKGDIIRINGEECVIPISNRLILDYDHIHSSLPIDPGFLTYCEQNADKFYSYNVSGFNAITDLLILKERVNQLKEHYLKIKEKNSDCRIYFEGAHYLNSKCKDYVFFALAECVDILGMNGEELADLCKEHGKLVNENNLESILSGLELVRRLYPVKGIVMHTKDYSLYFGAEMDKVNMEKGLTMGNLMAATKARIGRYGSYQDCEESLSLSLSLIGLKLVEELEKISTNQYICLVPSKYMEHPLDTIGLGDTFVAGMQIGFIHS